jgi:hypothetical protein
VTGTGFEGAGITVEAVAAPQTTGNTSNNLAKIIRNGGQAYAGVVTAVDTPLDFSTKSTITARIWTSAPIGTKVMFKTEECWQMLVIIVVKKMFLQLKPVNGKI